MITLSDTVATYVGFSPDGNIIDTFNLKEGESLKHEKQKSEEQKKYLKNLTEIGKMTNDLGGFYMLYYSDKLFDGKISDKHITRIIYLATYIEYDTNRLAYTQQGKKPIPLTERDIKRELDIDRKTYYDFRSEMTSNGIMIFKDNEIYLSKQYFNKGTEQEKDLFFTKMYINTIRELYSQISPKQHKTLAHLFRLIPYVNYKYNVITSTPHDSNKALQNRLNKKNIADLLELDLKTYEKIENQLLKLRITFREEEYYLIGLVTVKTDIKRQFYVVNPLLYSSSNDYEALENVWARMLKC